MEFRRYLDCLRRMLPGRAAAAGTPSFRVMSAVAVILAVALACATSAFSYLAAVSASSGKCGGQELLQGYRSGTLDFLAFPLFSAAFAVAVMKARTDRRTSDSLASDDVTVLALGSIRLTYGMLVVYSVLFGFAFFNATMTTFAAKRYIAISSYC